MAEQESRKAEAVEAKPPETKSKKLLTPEEFITRWPLYTPAPIEQFQPPARVSFHCDNSSTCGKETTWTRIGDVQRIALEGVNNVPRWVWYVCGLCNKSQLFVIYREAAWEQRPVRTSSGLTRTPTPSLFTTIVTKVQKIGQYPAQSIELPKGLQKNLSEDALSLYKKGLINRNEGYGLGAVTYIRRVVEDETNDLIEVAAQLAESHHVEADVVKKIRAAATERTTYDQKLKIAATVFPESLLIEGINPLGELYDLVSEGVHGLTEEQCIAVADETTSMFEFIFTNLRAQIAARQGFVEKVKKWAGRGTAQQK